MLAWLRNVNGSDLNFDAKLFFMLINNSHEKKSEIPARNFFVNVMQEATAAATTPKKSFGSAHTVGEEREGKFHHHVNPTAVIAGKRGKKWTEEIIKYDDEKSISNLHFI